MVCVSPETVYLNHIYCMMGTGVQKCGTAGTASTGQMRFTYKIIGHSMSRAQKSCLTLPNWILGSLTSDLNAFSNKY